MNDSEITVKEILDNQQDHWIQAFSRSPEMFGSSPSEPARKAAELFKKEGINRILELGAGQGRDTIFFAQQGFRIDALDYSQNALDCITKKAQILNLSSAVSTVSQDIRLRLPFEEGSFDACFSHMLFCMALTTQELEFLCEEIRRVLKPGGTCVYTTRHTNDVHYGKGIPRGEGMFEMNGFIVHYFDKAKIEHLANGFQLLTTDEFEEGNLPRKLYRVTMRKKE